MLSDFILTQINCAPSHHPPQTSQPSISLDVTRPRGFHERGQWSIERGRGREVGWKLMLGTAVVVCLVTEQGWDGVHVYCMCVSKRRVEEGFRAQRGACNFILARLQLLLSAAQNFSHSAKCQARASPVNHSFSDVFLGWLYTLHLIYFWGTGAIEHCE